MSSPTNDASADLATLLTGAARGEQSCLEALIALHEPRVYGLARAILKDPQMAEDATQETMVRMIQQLPRATPSARGFDTWLLCIARNVSISMIRKQIVRNEVSSESDSGERDAQPGDIEPLEQMINRESAARIRAAIDELPGAYREVLVLRFFHHLEFEDTARVAGITVANVRVRLHRALSLLRQQLGGE